MRRAAALLLTAGLLAGCGGSSGPDGAAGPGGSGSAARPAPERTVEPGAADVVRAWSRDITRGDVDAATDRFAVPARVANGTPEIRLTKRSEVRRFNETLPCGSQVIQTVEHHGLIIATFELRDRPGARCDGTGDEAAAAFEIRDGKIVRWLRVPTPSESPAEPSGPVI